MTAVRLCAFPDPSLWWPARPDPCPRLQRIDCKMFSQDTCEASDCCWQPQHKNSATPWCFHDPPTCNGSTDTKIDCKLFNEDDCTDAGCCWDPVSPNPNNEPYCYHKPTQYKVTANSKTTAGFELDLDLVRGAYRYGGDISPLKVEVVEETNDRVHIRIVDPNETRYEVPDEAFPRPDPPSGPPSSPNYAVSYTSQPFGFAVTRSADDFVIFNSTWASSEAYQSLVFEDQYLELSTRIPSGSTLYGLGEQTRPSGIALQAGDVYTMWNRDQPSSGTNQNLYGTHPFFLNMNGGKASGVFLLNSNGMDIEYDGTAITYKVIGGILDFYVFVGPSPAQVVQQYQALVGMPTFPPYWSLGFHQSKYGYKNLGELQTVVAKYKENKIPLDTMWSDIDYMDAYFDFTLDPVNYPAVGMNAFVDKLHADGQHYVVIIDPGIAEFNSTYPAYTRGIDQQVFIRDNAGDFFLGKVWPGLVYFPDWFNPNMTNYWNKEVSDFIDLLPVDGLWIDMNEASNFCNGECAQATDRTSAKLAAAKSAAGVPAAQPAPQQPHVKRARQAVAVHADEHDVGGARAARHHNAAAAWPRSDDPYFDPNTPPYAIDNCASNCALDTKSISMDATQYPHGTDGASLYYNTHNLYGLMEGIFTKAALEKKTQKRSFILTRSTFAGAGSHVAHWTGDNYSSWDDMAYSIIQILNFGLFGVPHIGCDLCGFLGTTTAEMCARWMQVGAFYTFSRNHNDIASPNQEPYLWPTTATASRNALTVRYTLLPYYYTLMALASSNGDTVVRPLFFEFPDDSNTLSVDTEFLVGPSVLVMPVITKGATSVTNYVPDDRWFDYYTRKQLSSAGQDITLSAPISHINVLLRGNSVIPTQPYTPPQTAENAKNNPYELLVVPGSDGGADGQLFMDDGVSLNTVSGGNYLSVSFSGSTTAAGGSLTSAIDHSGYSGASSLVIDSVVFLGTASASNPVLNSNAIPAAQVAVNTTANTVTFSGLNQPMASPFTLTFDP